MSDLLIYIKQRINLSVFILLTLFLILISKTQFSLGIDDGLHFILVFAFLFITRLYDDLQSAEEDIIKSDRNYTEEITKQVLIKWNILLALLFIILFSFIDRFQSIFVILFFVLNHLAYILFRHKNQIKVFLPLLKYSFICLYLMQTFDWIMVTVFLAMLTFEILEDETFPLARNIAYISGTLSIVLLFSALELKQLVLMSSAIGLVLYIIKVRWKLAPYLFMFIFLFTRLIIISNDF